MNNLPEKLQELQIKLEKLQSKQDSFSSEIQSLRSEIEQLLASSTQSEFDLEEPKLSQEFTPSVVPVNEVQSDIPRTEKRERPKADYVVRKKIPSHRETAKNRSDFEKFIGENLISKVGIIITILGVAIGAKYSIDHNLISPITRIILGYLAGAGLLGFGIKLKKKYESYSAVLVSGAVAILYFITYTAYTFYDLMPRVMAFVLMLIFTVLAVYASIIYNKKVIAQIGLVGAYAVPFLLSDASGNVSVLFTYMAIINVGILVISFKKYWKSLFYSAFGLTWLIYFSWYLIRYSFKWHFNVALIFAFIFFLTFYITFLAYKIVKSETFSFSDILLVLANSFVFYTIGYVSLMGHRFEDMLGIFTVFNAAIHFAISLWVYSRKLADSNLFYLIAGLSLIFITMAIPVQLDGNWVTLLWAGEATLLFWIGRTKNNPIYEKLSYPLIILAVASLAQDWSTSYGNNDFAQIRNHIAPFLNIHFLTSLLVTGALGFISYQSWKQPLSPLRIAKNDLSKVITILIPAAFLIVLYNSFSLEISNFWFQQSDHSLLTFGADENEYIEYYWNPDLTHLRQIWLINYSLLFITLLGFVNMKWIKNQMLAVSSIFLIIIAIISFLIGGLYSLSELRETFIDPTLASEYSHSSFNIIIRYISLGFVSAGLIGLHKFVRQDYMKVSYKRTFDLILHITLVWTISSELIHWMDFADLSQSYKLALSILWGIYSLMLIALGIWKKKQHLRILAIVLFAITLIKLFVYDISHLSTISKTIVFVSLGVLLLLISFLYNKYKNEIYDERGEG